jgi:uncharacterized SAM-binding protein YcdF (DUF218 family)
MLRWIERLLAVCGLLVIAFVLLAFTTYETVPARNCKRTHFDTILVLGSPASLDGQPSPEERERVMEGVREFKAGRAGHMIFTGGPTQNQFVEGQVMAGLAEANGVPAEDVVVEGASHYTIENICFSYRIMQQRGWTSAEVVSSPSHLPRAELILEHYSFQWQTHAARWPPEYGRKQIAMIYFAEAMDTLVLRWHGFPPSPFLPRKTASAHLQSGTAE